MKALILDTETTGLINSLALPLERQPEIIEFYAVHIDLATGKKAPFKKRGAKSELEFLCRPTKPISDLITKITGINNSQVECLPPFSHFASEVKKTIEAAEAVIAHNVSFDRDMVDLEMKRCGIEIKWPRLICTIEQTMHLAGHRLNLSKLHQHLFNEPFAGAHRAKVDVAALVRCCSKLHEQGAIA